VPADVARRKVELFARFDLVLVHPNVILQAIDLHRLSQVSFWDALVSVRRSEEVARYFTRRIWKTVKSLTAFGSSIRLRNWVAEFDRAARLLARISHGFRSETPVVVGSREKCGLARFEPRCAVAERVGWDVHAVEQVDEQVGDGLLLGCDVASAASAAGHQQGQIGA